MKSPLQLCDIAEAIVDCEHKTAPTVEDGIPLIRTANISNGFLDLIGANKISEAVYRDWTSRLEPRPNDIILAREAPVGEVGIVPPEARVCLGQRTVLIRPDQRFVVPRYLLYLLLTPQMRHQLISLSEGSTVPHLNMSEIRKLELPELPSLAEQRQIADVLGAFDDKAGLNCRMNKTIESIARAIFKSWFIDFDPVRAKAEGKQPFGMDEETAALFPSEFEDSELGKIPKGWKTGSVEEEFKLTMGQSPPGSTYNEEGEGIAFFQGRTDFGFRYPTPRICCTSPTRFANPGDTLVSVRAPVGDVNMAKTSCCIGRGLAALRHNSGSRSYTYYSMIALNPSFSKFESEGTVFGCINKEGFRSLRAIVPLDKLVSRFESTVSPMDQMIDNNEEQTNTLTRIRDALIPKLLSGELRAPAGNHQT